MITQPDTDRMTNEEASAFAKKLEAFESSLTPKERLLFQEILSGFSPPATEGGEEEVVFWAGDAE